MFKSVNANSYYNHSIFQGNTKSFQILDLDSQFWYSDSMKSIDEQILRAAKEIVVKFIEMGRLSPSNFNESFKDIYAAVDEIVKKTVNQDPPSNDIPG